MDSRVPLTDDEAAALVAFVYLELFDMPSPQHYEQPKQTQSNWRFSGRWWAQPVPLRRSRTF